MKSFSVLTTTNQQKSNTQLWIKSQINIMCHSCLSFLSVEKQSSLQAESSALHKYMTLSSATVLLMGFVAGCNNNSVSNTTSAVHCQPNALIQWIFGSFVSRVRDTLVCGCLWESCHCLVLRDYAHVGAHFWQLGCFLRHTALKIVFKHRFTLRSFFEAFFFKSSYSQ